MSRLPLSQLFLSVFLSQTKVVLFLLRMTALVFFWPARTTVSWVCQFFLCFQIQKEIWLINTRHFLRFPVRLWGLSFFRSEGILALLFQLLCFPFNRNLKSLWPPYLATTLLPRLHILSSTQLLPRHNSNPNTLPSPKCGWEGLPLLFSTPASLFSYS